MYYDDWFVRHIRAAIEFIARLVFNSGDVSYEIRDENKRTETDLLFLRLLALLNDGHLNEAENLLYEELDTNDREHLRLALDFYKRLNALSDAELESNNFSREDIVKGVGDIKLLFGIV